MRIVARLVGAAVRIKDDVNDRMLKSQRMEGQLGAERGRKIYDRSQAVHVCIRLLAGRFLAMNSLVADFYLKTQRHRVEAAQFCATTAGALNLCD